MEERHAGIEERNWEESEGESNGIRGRPGKIAIEGEAGGEKVRKDWRRRRRHGYRRTRRVKVVPTKKTMKKWIEIAG